MCARARVCGRVGVRACVRVLVGHARTDGVEGGNRKWRSEKVATERGMEGRIGEKVLLYYFLATSKIIAFVCCCFTP